MLLYKDEWGEWMKRDDIACHVSVDREAPAGTAWWASCRR